MPLRCITVGAKHLEPRWKAVLDNPLSDGLRTNLLSVGTSTPISVLHLEKLNVCLSATGTTRRVAPIMPQNHQPPLSLLLSTILPVAGAAIGQRCAPLRFVKLLHTLILPTPRAALS